MAKQIIILNDRISDGYRYIGAVFWFPVPVGSELPIPGRQSGWRGASAAEEQSLVDGEVIEETLQLTLPGDASVADLKAALIDLYTSRDAAYDTTQPAIGWPGAYYGTYYDGVDWTAG